jgi:uncharacterized protein YcfJ
MMQRCDVFRETALMTRTLAIAGAAGLFGLSACAVAPTSPSVLALPPRGKPYAQFQAEDQNCRGYAQQQTAGMAEQANNRAVGAAVLGTAIGAASGALIGAPFRGGAGIGAGYGAGAGLATGSAIGAGQSDAANYTLQQRFDITYTQCMYAAGNSVQSPPVGFAPPPVGYAAPAYYAPGYVGPYYRPY